MTTAKVFYLNEKREEGKGSVCVIMECRDDCSSYCSNLPSPGVKVFRLSNNRKLRKKYISRTIPRATAYDPCPEIDDAEELIY